MLHPLLIYLSIILFNLCLYWRTLSYGLVIDDIEWQAKFKHGFPPITCIDYALLRLYSFYPPFSNRINHIITLSLHILTCCLIAVVFNPVAAFLYSAHPINHQTAVWLNGRRYSLITIIVLLLLLAHAAIFLIPLGGILLLHFRREYLNRCHLPHHPYSIITTVRCLGASAVKIIGAQKPAFLYPFLELGDPSAKSIDKYFWIGAFSAITLLFLNPAVLIILLVTSSLYTFTQAAAERYLVIPTILLLSTLPPVAIILIIPYTYLSYNLQPLYTNIQAFYNYHKYMKLNKLPLLRRLYPEIIS